VREVCEFRIKERLVPLLPDQKIGKCLGTIVRQIKVETDDPLFAKIGELEHRLLATKGYGLFTYWNIARSYTAAELKSAEIFRVFITTAFEPTGEECGTRYDEESACEVCGADAKQVSALFLRASKIPRLKEIARTIADEWVISRKLAETFKHGGVTGFELGPVRDGSRTGNGHDDSRYARATTSSHWHQLVVTSGRLSVAPATRTGIDPFNSDSKGEYRCPRGDNLGLRFISELYVQRATWDGSDIMVTREVTGPRVGLIRPTHAILISARMRNLLLDQKVKGVSFEIAHFV
jgi:hypothetical protein